MKLALVAGVVLLPALAHAQDPTVNHTPSLQADRLGHFAVGPGGFYAVQDGELAEPGGLVVGLVGGYADRLLVVRDVRDGDELSVPVARRIGFDLGVAYGVGDTLQVGVTLPLVAYQGGDRLRGLELGEDDELRAVTVGDLRLGAKYALVTAGGVDAGVALTLGLPTGDDQHFAGEAASWGELQLLLAHRARTWRVAMNVGLRLLGEEVDFLSPEVTVGNELLYGAAGELDLPWDERWSVLVETVGARGDHGLSPAELRGGVRYAVAPGWQAGLFAGGALSGDELGSARARFGFEVRWQARPRDDHDGDGVPDRLDGCREAGEDLDDFEDADGCPDLDDDQDRVADAVDECPAEAEDADRFLDDDGCPDPDNDRDGVADGSDVCPFDADDACPAAPEPVRDEDFAPGE